MKKKKNKVFTSYHVGVSAEAFAAGFFAHAGWHVSVQYGANQPGYHLLVEKRNKILKVSVKGSQDGGWSLIQSHKKPGITYRVAIVKWFAKQPKNVIFCFVQFKGVKLGECPRIYLATAKEVMDVLLKTRNGVGGTLLCENHTYVRGVGKEIAIKSLFTGIFLLTA